MGDLLFMRVVGLGCASRGAPNPVVARENGDGRRRRGGGRRREQWPEEPGSDAKLKLEIK